MEKSMTKRRQHQSCVSAIQSLEARALSILATVFITAVIVTPAAQGQVSNAQRHTCHGSTKPLTPSPGCTPVYFFQGGADGGDPIGGVTLGANGALYGT